VVKLLSLCCIIALVVFNYLSITLSRGRRKRQTQIRESRSHLAYMTCCHGR